MRHHRQYIIKHPVHTWDTRPFFLLHHFQHLTSTYPYFSACFIKSNMILEEDTLKIWIHWMKSIYKINQHNQHCLDFFDEQKISSNVNFLGSYRWRYFTVRCFLSGANFIYTGSWNKLIKLELLIADSKIGRYFFFSSEMIRW